MSIIYDRAKFNKIKKTLDAGKRKYILNRSILYALLLAIFMPLFQMYIFNSGERTIQYYLTLLTDKNFK